MKNGTQLWLGSQQSYEQCLEAVIKAQANAGFKADSSYAEEVLQQVLCVDNGVGVINVRGSLSDGSAGYAVFYGAIGYDDIRNALAAAVTNPMVGSILLDIGSGGGDVAGCSETSMLIARVNKIKPVVTYTGSSMCSAALWLGCQASYIYTAETATVGSVGIIMVHMDRTEQLKAMGVKATVIRAGDDKALSSPYEPLSDKAKADLQAKADALDAIFLGQVATARGMSVAVAEGKFGTGKEFLGKDAVTAGLADAVGTYEDAFAKAQSLIKLKKPTASVKSAYGATNSGGVLAQAASDTGVVLDNRANPQGTQMLKPLSTEQLLAMTAGVELEEAQPAKTDAEIAAEAATAAAAAVEAIKPVEGQAATFADNSAITMLQGMLASAQTDLIASRMEAQTAVAALAVATAQASAFVEIARASVKTISHHYGIKHKAVAAMDASEVLSEHTRLIALFKAEFPGGAVAATSSEAQKPKASVPLYFAAVTKPHAK